MTVINKTNKLIVAGFDPSFSNFGMVKGTLDILSGEFELTHIELTQTKPDSKNKKVRQNSKDLVRAQQLHKGMTAFMGDVDIICVEIPVGSQSSRACVSYGACIGIIAALKVPLIQVTPNEVKLAAVDDKQATKQQMIKWVTTEYPNAPWLTRQVKGETQLLNSNEHLADATACIHAGVKTDEFQGMLNMLKSIRN